MIYLCWINTVDLSVRAGQFVTSNAIFATLLLVQDGAGTDDEDGAQDDAEADDEDEDADQDGAEADEADEADQWGRLARFSLKSHSPCSAPSLLVLHLSSSSLSLLLPHLSFSSMMSVIFMIITSAWCEIKWSLKPTRLLSDKWRNPIMQKQLTIWKMKPVWNVLFTYTLYTRVPFFWISKIYVFFGMTSQRSNSLDPIRLSLTLSSTLRNFKPFLPPILQRGSGR